MAPRHITVILPAKYRGGSLRITKNIVRMLLKGSQNYGEQCQVRLAVRADTYDIGEEFRDLIDNGVEVREISFKEVPPEDVNNANYFQGRNIDLQSRTYWLMEDGQNNCADSDLWLVVSYSVEYPIAPIRPTLIFATDFIQRYVPDIIWPPRPGEGDAEALAFLRQSDGVLATTPHTRLDAISYAGLPASKVYLAPMEFDPTFLDRYRSVSKVKEPYFLWPTNPNAHKNHAKAFQALDLYYGKLKGKIKTKIVGVSSVRMDPSHRWQAKYENKAYVKSVREIVAGLDNLKSNVEFAGEVADKEYAELLASACFLWHPTLADNGTFAAVEAAYMGCPTLSNDYPQMRYISNRFEIPMQYFNARSVKEMASALKQMEETPIDVGLLPSRETLSLHSWEAHASEYWDVIVRAAA
ncbi:glycosyltransferase family 4 protein [Brucella melitensis]|uniref:Glycosyl transferase n=1 Tax=Brucella melitensis TaxID=29459 RepID=A0AB36PSP0_BRUML|nr:MULTISPECIES: glycosyltransferase [Brucella]AOG52724.1 glycosyl transferase [Brucella melitensis]AQQ57263.1 glycosyl transferase [Brucella melitensis]ARX99197.1 glycosyl transferase [Brucella melitensis]ARY02375.1 glycosyl transferase [Brucella melitensis]ARY05558.1 glycosyl transferase [Brucella melitensis]